MKKILLLVLLSFLLASASSAQLLIGGQASGMGGAGIATASDLAAAYYNPAGLMRSNIKATEIKLSLGAQYTDPTALTNAISKANDAATFIANNYGNSFSFNGSVDGVIGLNVKKVGLTIIPVANATVNKNANSVVGSVNASGTYSGVLTLGKTFAVAYLPAALDVGLNVKAISAYTGALTTTGTATNASGTRTYGTGSGLGFDLGVLTSFSVPMVTELKVGAVIRNLAQSIKYSNKSQTSTLTYSGGSATVSSSPEVSQPDSTTTFDPSYGIGASAVVPGINLLIAGDIETSTAGSNTHVGVEYPLMLKTLLLRAGYATGNNLAKTTVGAKLNLPFMNLDAVLISDSKNSGSTAYVVDAGFAF